jgi:ribosomal protein S18 acetylase RimI-like enzyme
MIREVLPPDTGLVHEAMRPLRPQFADRAAFVARVDDVQRPEGYRLVAAFEDGAEQAVAVAGFRIVHLMGWGERTLYVDDLSTHPAARRRGHARALLDWLADEARREGCDALHLDSAVGPERLDAHRLYFNAGMRIASYHFVTPVGR